MALWGFFVVGTREPLLPYMLASSERKRSNAYFLRPISAPYRTGQWDFGRFLLLLLLGERAASKTHETSNLDAAQVPAVQRRTSAQVRLLLLSAER